MGSEPEQKLLRLPVYWGGGPTPISGRKMRPPPPRRRRNTRGFDFCSHSESDPDVPIDLQALIDPCYEAGRYDETDYRADPCPPLESSYASWAADLLRLEGLRP
jgi:hypothetical protein